MVESGEAEVAFAISHEHTSHTSRGSQLLRGFDTDNDHRFRERFA